MAEVCCPHCQQAILDDGSQQGRIVGCPHCGCEFTMPTSDVADDLANLVFRKSTAAAGHRPRASPNRSALVLALVLAIGIGVAMVTGLGDLIVTGRTTVSSSALRSVGYDSTWQVLEIEFQSGEVYRYYDVPPAVHAELMRAESKGQFFVQHIRNQGYAYERLGPTTSFARKKPSPEFPEPEKIGSQALKSKQSVSVAPRAKSTQQSDSRSTPRVRTYASPQPTRMAELDGHASLVSDDGKFLGLISSNEFDPKSIVNEVGNYGSEISPDSIFNDVGQYGGDISQESPWNDLAFSPPRIVINGRFVAFLTKNDVKTPRIDPHALIRFLKSKRITTGCRGKTGVQMRRTLQESVSR